MDYNKLKIAVETSSFGISGVFKKLNISRGSFYYAIEKQTLKIETLEKICELLQISILHFFPTNDVLVTSDTQFGGLEITEGEIINYKEKYLQEQAKYLQTLEKLNQANERLLAFTDPKKDITKKAKS